MERLMQYVWQHRLLLCDDLVTVDGRPVKVIDPGQLNTGSGPDFFNAKLIIGDTYWAGNVEMHVRASDWHRHGHDGDRAYDSVVLHVVDRDDTRISRPDGREIPQLVMKCAPDFHSRYSQLVDRSDIDLPCAADLASASPLHISDWLTAMGYERLYDKADRVTALLERFTGDWEETTYVTLARALGFGLNSEPMERLALSMPLRFLRKHSDSPIAIEALLFGQAGFLEAEHGPDGYYDSLAREYRFLAHKFSLKPMMSPGWKTGRTRPQNLPYGRIATLANIIAGTRHLASRLIEAREVTDNIELFRMAPPPYWTTHYTFGSGSQVPHEGLSLSSAMVLAINVCVPVLAAYGMHIGDDRYTERAVEWLHQLPSERNHIVSLFARAGVSSRDAFSSQALIQARRRYCETHSCIFCRIGHRTLAARAKR